jgi:DNA sulfur modification protein DndB
MAKTLHVPGFELQTTPRIYVTSLPGRWLLDHTTPSWRLKNPKKGFQRIVKPQRAEQIAISVLDQGRTFPNAIILATDRPEFPRRDGHLDVPPSAKFLVVDGQHRLWAQTYSDHEAEYACVLHTGLTEVDMARLFLEINDNQKRVPASLRWDLVRLVRPDADPSVVAAAELTYALASERESPLYQRIDLTGEIPEISLKQGSIAPELKMFVSTRVARLKDLDFETHYDILVRYLSAIRSVDPDGWKSGKSPLYKARVLRMLLRLLPLIIKDSRKDPKNLSATVLREYVQRIDLNALSDDAIRAAQGSAGMKEIFEVLKQQILS